MILSILLLPVLLTLVTAQVNECDTDNGGCEQNCHNTDLSYYCTCDSGYRVLADLHSCLWLNCDDPGGLQDGTVTDTNEWWTESYAEYSCDDPIFHTLVGNEHRRCNDHDQWVEWSGAIPACYDDCQLGILGRECNPPGGDPEQCKQLGCCFVEDSEFCYHKEVPSFIQYGGKRPTENGGNGYGIVEYGTEPGCKTQCAIPGGTTCKAYGMDHKGWEEQPDEVWIEQKDCHFWDKSKSEYEDLGMWGDDENFNFYDMIPTSVGRSRTQDGTFYHTENVDYHDVDNLLEGCFKDDESERDLPFHLWTKTYATISSCINDCRDWSFKYAGLQNGNECRCGNSIFRIHGNASDYDCDAPCSGDANQICGGDTVNSVFYVPFDTRYIGCYYPEEFPIKLWDNDTENSAIDCLEECLLQDYYYAAVHNGGACFCKDSYGDGGIAPHIDCGMQCGERWGENDCGGEEEYSFYNTRFAKDMMGGGIPNDVSTMYLDDADISGISCSIFGSNSKLKSVVTPRITLHASQVVSTPTEDSDCHDDCYKACGAIYHPEGLSNRGEDVYLRFFHINLADIEQYAGDYAERVYVYAQTVVIDRDVDLPFSVNVRARQLIVDNTVAAWIQVDSSKLVLYPDGIDHITTFGPEVDLTFIRQSYMCARILLDTRDQDDANSAWAILHDLGHGHAFSEEHEDYMEGVRMYTAAASGVHRSGSHIAPFYTKDYIAEFLEIYFDRISAYNVIYKDIQSGIDDKWEFIGFVDEMLTIQMSTDVYEATRSFQGAYAALERSNATYHRMYDLYNESRDALDEATEVFQQGIEDALTGAVQSAMDDFTKGVTNMVFGRRRRRFNYREMVQNLKNFIAGLQKLAESMEKLEECLEAIERMMHWMDDMLSRLDQILEDIRYGAYMGDIETASRIYESIVHWENIKVNTDIIMYDDLIRGIDGATGYHIAMIETCNWGEALSRSMLELADSMRETVSQKMYLESKLHQAKRYDDYLRSLEADLIEQELMLTYMLELEYDIRLDLNDMLFTYCQAFFYEHVTECSQLYAPAFGGSIDELLLKISFALEDNIWAGPDVPFPVNRPIVIRDDPDTPADCVDYKVCPINYLRNNRIFVYDFEMGHSDIADLDKYRISEIVMDFEGAVATGENRQLKLKIESSGPFLTRYKNDVYSFVSTALTLTYEYYIDSCDEYYNCEITIRATPYDPLGDVIMHITPYTKWVVTMSDMISDDIDVSQVTAVAMVLDGSAIDNELRAEEVDQP